MEKHKKSHKKIINLKYQIRQEDHKEFELPDGSYSLPDVQGYFKCILKKTWNSYR